MKSRLAVMPCVTPIPKIVNSRTAKVDVTHSAFDAIVFTMGSRREVPGRINIRKINSAILALEVVTVTVVLFKPRLELVDGHAMKFSAT